MPMKKLMMLALALFAAGGAMAQMNPMQPIPADKDLRTGKLENGLTYYIRHNEKPKGQADFYILHDVGAIQEDDDQQGLAHFLEHMAFNGTKNLPGKQMIEYLETVGVKFGYNLNAATSWDYTVYNISDVPTARQGVIDSALLVLHDWSHFIALQPEEIDSERGVIMEELRTRDGASWRSTMKLLQALGMSRFSFISSRSNPSRRSVCRRLFLVSAITILIISRIIITVNKISVMILVYFEQM